jgi:hypothetical protein
VFGVPMGAVINDGDGLHVMTPVGEGQRSANGPLRQH